jgi:hypothetical protein
MTPDCLLHQVQLIKRDPNGRPDEGEVIGTKGAGEHLGVKTPL